MDERETEGVRERDREEKGGGELDRERDGELKRGKTGRENQRGVKGREKDGKSETER